MEPPPPAEKVVQQPGPRSRTSSSVLHSLLIVEDDESHIELIQRAFEAQPDCVNLTFARTLKGAKEMILAHPPDLIIADWLLPDGKGVDLITHFAGTRSIPVLMMTSHGNEILAVEMMKAGAIDYIVKSDVTLISMPHIVRNAWLEWNAENTRKRMTAALDESEQKYHEIFNKINDAIEIHGISESGLPGTFTEVNDVACRMLGYTPEEFKTLEPLEISTEYHSRPVPEIMQELFTSGHSTFETGQIRKDGTIIPVEVSAHLVMLQGGQVILSVVRDITDRKSAEDALRESEDRYRAISEYSHNAICIIDENARITWCNDEMLSLGGYSKEQVYGAESFVSFIAPESLEFVTTNFSHLLEGAAYEHHYNFFISRSDGEKRLCANQMMDFRDKHGKRQLIISMVDITEKTRAEEELKRQHSLLKGVLESTDTAVFSLDRNYCYTSFNSHHARVMKMLYGADIEPGRNIFDYQSVHEDQSRAKDNIDRALAGEKFTDEAYSGEGDSQRYFEVTHNPVRDPDNTISGVAVFARDTTLRKQAENELKQSAEKYQTLIESANEGIIVIQDGKIPYANQKAQEIIGYPANYLAEKNFLEIVHPDDRDETIYRHMKRIKGEHFESIATLRVIDNKGAIHWSEVNAVLIQWNKRPATLNFITDITKRKDAEGALHESEEKYRSVIEHIQDVFYRTDTIGTIIMASPSIAGVFGYDSVDECLNKPVTMLYRDPEQREVFLAEIEKQGFVDNYPMEMKKKDGTPVIISASSHYYYDNSGNILGVEGILRDITAQKEAESALRDSLAEKEVLLKEIHHRVKNNLQIVSGLLYLQSKLAKDPETKDILSACRNRITSMALLHENLFQISNFSSVSMSPYINNLVRYLADSYETEKYLVFEVNIPGDISLDIDTGIAIGMIVTELATNSIKYAFPPGESGRVQVTLNPSGNGMLLSVRDNGKGLPEGYNLTPNPGLGMKLVENLVRQVHGTMDVKRGQGTVVSIVFTTGIVTGIRQVPANH